MRETKWTTMMKCAIVLMSTALLPPAVRASDALPAHLTGFWCTAESLYAGTVGQTELILADDGYGLFAGSTPPAHRLDGTNDGKPAPRAIIGSPVRVTLNGNMLTAHPFMPGGGKEAAEVATLIISCRYDAAGPTLTCAGPTGGPFTMRRISETIPAEVAQMLDAIRSQASATRAPEHGSSQR
jgi:hypothetical protein